MAVNCYSVIKSEIMKGHWQIGVSCPESCAFLNLTQVCGWYGLAKALLASKVHFPEYQKNTAFAIIPIKCMSRCQTKKMERKKERVLGGTSVQNRKRAPFLHEDTKQASSHLGCRDWLLGFSPHLSLHLNNCSVKTYKMMLSSAEESKLEP